MAIARDKKQEEEWKNAQDINVSLDLLSAAKQQLKFLAAVDHNNSWLCKDGPLLQRAIYRYTECWIPLLAKHTKSPLFEGPLVVPLDCEWIWHCHRLNPLTYKSDCEELYGMILDNKNVVSSTQEVLGKEGEDVWNRLHPTESFELDPNDNNEEKKLTKAGKFTKYDLTFAVQRQSTFFSQVSEPCMSNDLYLEGAVARYKGFLHLVKRNIERNIHNFVAPTYDIDLIWHTHQLHPILYGNDLKNTLGAIVGHDDTVSDRKRGEKLDVGFTRTINGWADLYGSRYRRAGALHKFSPTFENKSICSDVTHLPEFKMMDVMLEFVNVKNMPEEHKGKQLLVSFSKTQPDALFMGKKTLPMLSAFEEQVASFKCQPTGKLLFELLACSPSNNEVSHPTQTLGSCSVSLEDLLLPESGFMLEKWLELKPSTDCESIKPISLRMGISVTPPTPAPLSLDLIRLAACLSTNPGGISSDNEAFPFFVISDANNCVWNCATVHSNSDRIACVNDSKTNACDASMCVRVIEDTCYKPNVTNAGSCIANCVVISNANDSKTNACDASMCVRVIEDTCYKPNVTNAGSCIANCVVISNANASDASAGGVCAPIANASDASACGVCESNMCRSGIPCA